MMYQLRPYQVELVNKARDSLKKNKSVLIVLGCGGGKSVIAANIAKTSTSRGKRVLFIVHRKELCEQIADTFTECGVDMELCTIGMVQTLARRDIEKPALLIIDEAHHAMAKSYQTVIEKCEKPYIVGFTATPTRLDGKDLTEVFKATVKGKDVQWLIDNHYLSDYTAYNSPLISTKRMRIQAGDYRMEDIDRAFNEAGKTIYGKAVKEWQRAANGKKTIVYCHKVEAAKKLAMEYQQAGITAASLDGETPKAERDKVVHQFRQGEITVLTNVDLFGEGFDVPDCECVQLLRPTASFTVFVQQSMRSMRYQEGKHALILDHTENIEKFGTPKNLFPQKEKGKGKKRELPFVRYCPNCQCVIEGNPKECPACGYELRENKPAKVIDTPLKAIDESEIQIKKNLIPQTWEDIVALQKGSGYKFGWCFYQAKTWNIPVPSKYRAYCYRMGIR